MSNIVDEIKKSLCNNKHNGDNYLEYLEKGIDEFEDLQREGLVSPRGNNLIAIEEKFSKKFCFNTQGTDCP